MTTGLLRRAVLGAVGVVLAAATGCSSDDASPPEAQPPASASPSSAAPSPAVDDRGFPMPTRPRCADDAGGEYVTTTTSAGNGVGMLLIGSGTAGVVLAPEDDGDVCQWLPYAEELATSHRVAVLDRWADPRAELPALAAHALREAGAREVVFGGASFGGATVMSEAHRLRPAPAGVFSLGGELTLPGLDFRPGIARWHGPLLQLGSHRDHFFDAADARRLQALHPGDETVVVLPGRTHGVALLRGADGDRVRAAIDDFLDQVLD
ncbi:alpha/beta hydrolase [Nocardioides sp.]|uniref:alpha/beta hydrolase n=1 Tax=Nocardioides sp. TaxID=35761 RepID=UPI0037830FC1